MTKKETKRRFHKDQKDKTAAIIIESFMEDFIKNELPEKFKAFKEMKSYKNLLKEYSIEYIIIPKKLLL